LADGLVQVIVKLFPAFTAGTVLSTVTVTLDVAVQPLAPVPTTV
jgi:hypothetical protein